MSQFHLQIITPERVEFDGDIVSLVAPGGAGYLGVLAGHAPLLTTLRSGKITLTHPGEEQPPRQTLYAVEGAGFLEVHRDKAVILAQTLTEMQPQFD